MDDFDDSTLEKDELLAPKKKPFNFQEFINSFNSLDPQNMGSWPTSVKITIYIFVLLVTLALAYFVLIRPLLNDIDNARAQEESLLNEYREKDSKLRNLQLYQKQIEDMERTFGELLQQLPKETEIPGLVEDINFTGVSSGLRFNNISVQPEVKQEFFIELPISIVAQGDYHAFGSFVSGLAALPRIVTLHDFVIETLPESETKSEVPVLKMTVQAKTYRYNDQPAEDSSTPAPAAGAPK
ncbi:type IV pilus inner membrane component PilO [Alkanindiges illinoisensis]|uniref:type 4a pilus biogenesis protein PilO n=1 Tax=Alkanindiges illinoisensis TaxID=197183 RepID=UPI00047CC797|nr:type 4a pilus biogenesis protein PilO [Alkanindiges illinoisensis]